MTASLATCPLCAKQLAIPEGTSPDQRAECPECDATFLLSNAFQTSLPTARILKTIKESSPLEKTLSEEKPPSKIAGVASLASWESRLKNAIEQEATELADPPSTTKTSTAKTPKTETPKAKTPAAEPSRVSGPEFDFHIDPPLAEQPLENERVKNERALETEKNSVVGKFDTAELATTELTEAAAAEAAELTVGLNTLHTRRARRFSPFKAAAMLLGPGLLGISLGLYALLWIKGPSGDLINLTQILPEAMLPATITAPEIESPKETTPPPADEQGLLVKEEPTEEPQRDETRHDEAVQLATAEEPMPQALGTLPEQFSEQIDAARTAEPDLIGGDLNTNEAVSQKGQAYMALCQLAQNFEAIHLPELDAPSQAKIASAKELFASLASHPSAQSDLAAIASRWWGYESRPNQGIFFAGRIQETQPLGNQILCYVALDEPATTIVIPVLLSQRPDLDSNRIVVVGSIVPEPRNRLQGFTIDVPQVVVATYSQALQP